NDRAADRAILTSMPVPPLVGTAGAGRQPRADPDSIMPFHWCAKGSHGRAGEAMTVGCSFRCDSFGVRSVSPVVSNTETTKVHGGARRFAVWPPGDPVGNAGALREALS